MTVLELAEDYAAMQASAETQRAYRRDLLKWFEFSGPEPLTADLVTRFKRWLEESLSPNSAARTWGTVKGFHKYVATREGVFTPTPFDFVKAPKRPAGVTPKVPTDEDVQALIEGVSGSPRDSLVVALLLNGLRAGEVSAMRRSDVEVHDVDGSQVVMLRVNGKGKKQRLVPCSVRVELAVHRWLAHATEEQLASEWLVSDYNGDPLSVRQVEETVYRGGVEGMHPHALRHHYATRLVKAGASPMHVQRLLGHSNISTTMVYVTLDVADLVKAASLDPMDEPRIEAVKEAVAS